MMALADFYDKTVTIRRYPRSDDATSPGDSKRGTATTVWTGNVCIRPMDAREGEFQGRYGAETTHVVYMPVPASSSELPEERDEIVWGTRLFDILSVRNPHEFAAHRFVAHLEIEAIERDNIAA